jgi:hypothetical protein
MSRRIAELQAQQGILLKYRSIQTLKLTALQARVLEAITPEKIKSDSLVELCRAFEILKRAELGIEGDPPKIVGLIGYLVEMERQRKEEEGS